MDSYVGKRIDGRYEIREIIGVGGMAVVYKAYDNIDDRIVAVKILKEEFLANEEFRRRFKNESKAIAVLSHQNIVKVYDVSFGEKLQYIVMEYVEGITLKEYIQQQGVINCREVVHFTTQILRALQHAHDKGIVHRDIKPQNIMLLQNGTIKVTDFGIARFSRSETRTMTGNAIGSVHYISPEQARGEITDEKADIYSVGVLMYEMLTGQLPFQSDNAVSVALMQVQEEAVPPTAMNSSIPTGLEQITMRAMQKNTRDRYQTAAEMLLDIEEYKRNPSIIFDYSYLVNSNINTDDYIDEDDEYITPEDERDPDAFDDEYDMTQEEYDEYAGKGGFKKYLPIILGVIAAALVVGIVILVAVNFVGSKKTVPNFIGMNYNTQIKDNNEYKEFEIEIVEQADSEGKTPGLVLDQDPKAGEKYKSGSKITLTIVKNTGVIAVPDLSNLTLSAAQAQLKASGLTWETKNEYSDTVTEGSIIRTYPKAHETVKIGDKITLFVSDKNAEKSVKVPDILGSTVEAARTELEAIDLVLDENYTEVSSTQPQGTIVSCKPGVGELATIGSKITVTVSSGNSTNPTVTVTFRLPSDGSGDIVAKLNSNIVTDKKNYKFDGNTFTVTASGTGSDDKLTIFVDDSLYFSCSVDFTYTKPVTSNVVDNCGTCTVTTKAGVSNGESTTKQSNTKKSTEATGDAPSYVTYYYEYAKGELEALGYTVVIEWGTPDYDNAYMVESQSCDGNTVTLTVYNIVE